MVDADISGLGPGPLSTSTAITTVLGEGGARVVSSTIDYRYLIDTYVQ